MSEDKKIVDYSNSSITRFSIPDLAFSQENAMRFGGEGGTSQEFVTNLFGRSLLALLNSSEARTYLELGNIAVRNVDEFATALQGAKADTAVQLDDLPEIIQDVGTKSFEFRKTATGVQWRYVDSEGVEDNYFTYIAPLELYDGQTVVINASPTSVDKSFLLYIDESATVLNVSPNVDHPTAVFGAPNKIIFVNEETLDKFSVSVNTNGVLETRHFPEWKDWFSFRDVMSEAEPIQFRVNGTDIEWRAFSEDENAPWNVLVSFQDLAAVIDVNQFATAAQGQKADTALQSFNFTGEGKIRIGGASGIAQELQTTSQARSLLTASTAEQLKNSIWTYLIETKKNSTINWPEYTEGTKQGYFVYWRIKNSGNAWTKIQVSDSTATSYSILTIGRNNINRIIEFRVTAYWNGGLTESSILLDTEVDFAIAWADDTSNIDTSLFATAEQGAKADTALQTSQSTEDGRILLNSTLTEQQDILGSSLISQIDLLSLSVINSTNTLFFTPSSSSGIPSASNLVYSSWIVDSTEDGRMLLKATLQEQQDILGSSFETQLRFLELSAIHLINILKQS